MTETDIKYSYVTASAAKTFVEGVLIGNGVTPANGAVVADCLVQADMRGVDTQ
jgi:LDH2 family malate/lactate/ureidoglycolate dehydrogenase